MTTFATLLTTVPLVLGPGQAALSPPRDDAAALERLEDDSLATLRAAGTTSPAAPATADERSALAQAEARAADLEDRRAGDITNRELTTVLLVLGIVALIVIIA